MSMKKKPVTGMKDILPREMEIRDYVIGLIKQTYATFGFTSMETPCVEHIENLNSKQGGENEKLIFKILKRGEKLRLAEAKEEADLVDGGLRYDLTVPLSRYYANNAAELPAPFKALQMGNVWRADRPQRGRYRQFMQCDIDILGEATNLAEIELILATTTLLGKLDFSNFTIRINDRRILRAMAAYSGFPADSYDTVFIILDKMDKIGLDGVAEELAKEGYPQDAVDRYLELFRVITPDAAGVQTAKEKLKGYLDPADADALAEIIETVDAIKRADFRIVFDPTLVRGMSYYTGPIFEIALDGFGGGPPGAGLVVQGAAEGVRHGGLLEVAFFMRRDAHRVHQLPVHKVGPFGRHVVVGAVVNLPAGKRLVIERGQHIDGDCSIWLRLGRHQRRLGGEDLLRRLDQGCLRLVRCEREKQVLIDRRRIRNRYEIHLPACRSCLVRICLHGCQVLFKPCLVVGPEGLDQVAVLGKVNAVVVLAAGCALQGCLADDPLIAQRKLVVDVAFGVAGQVTGEKALRRDRWHLRQISVFMRRKTAVREQQESNPEAEQDGEEQRDGHILFCVFVLLHASGLLLHGQDQNLKYRNGL